jgi:short-subunit dehydrogenase involved in D-alanine esterification of teichoic acids
MIKEASLAMGANFHELFTTMIVNRRYEDVMDKSKKNKVKSRLGDKNDSKSQEELQEFALQYH